MGKNNTDYNIIDESYDCNQSAVEASAIRTSIAGRVSILPEDNIGGISTDFLARQTSRKNGQSVS